MKNKSQKLKTKVILFWLLLFAAIGLITDGSYIYAKAYLAQHLISDAWEQTLSGKRLVKPWPWADTWPVAQLNVPNKSINLFVLSGASGASLPFGPGHLTGTAFPGESGASIIAAHRDTHFNFLKDMAVGEHFQIQTQDNKIIHYKITNMKIADSRKQMLQTSAQSESLTLVTCYPFGAISSGGPLRYVVSAQKINYL